MLTLTDQLGSVQSVHYNVNGLRDKWTSPTGATYTFGYDTMNRITLYTDPLNNKTLYSYDADNRISSITNGAGETPSSPTTRWDMYSPSPTTAA